MKKHLSVLISEIVPLVIVLTLASAPVLTQAQGVLPEDQPENSISLNTIAPGAFPIQGRLTDASGNPLNGAYAMTFRLYENETGGATLCLDIFDDSTSGKIAVQNGLFYTYLDHCYDNLKGQKVWLGIKVGSDPEMTPRLAILPVPYAVSLVPGVDMIATINYPFSVTTSGTSGRGLQGVTTSATGTTYGVYGSAASPNGYGGYFTNSAGAAIIAEGTGVIKSSAKSYVWISGNGARAFNHDDSTIIDMDTVGGVKILRGATGGTKNIILPITIPGQLYGQNVRITAIDIHWVGATGSDKISAVLLRRQVNVCELNTPEMTCYDSLIYEPDDHSCSNDANAGGCILSYAATGNNVLSDNSGALYLTIEFAFNSEASIIQLGGVRLTLEHD